MDSILNQMNDIYIEFLEFLNPVFIGLFLPIAMYKFLMITLRPIVYDCRPSDCEYGNDAPDEYKTYLDEHIEVLIKKYDNME